MPKNIQLSDAVYQKLEGFRGKREPFSEAVDRLLTMLGKMGELRDIFEGGIKYDEWKRQELEKQAAAQR